MKSNDEIGLTSVSFFNPSELSSLKAAEMTDSLYMVLYI